MGWWYWYGKAKYRKSVLLGTSKNLTDLLYWTNLKHILTASLSNRGTSSTLVRLLHIPQLASERGGYRGRILKHCIFQAKPQTPDTESCFHGTMAAFEIDIWIVRRHSTRKEEGSSFGGLKHHTVWVLSLEKRGDLLPFSGWSWPRPLVNWTLQSYSN